MDRNAIYDRLFALGEAVTWGSGDTWEFSSQRLQVWTECPRQPAFYQVAHDNEFQQVTGMPYKVVLGATWVVYQDTAKDETVQGSRLNNTIIDALQEAMRPRMVAGSPFSDRNTLGGMVYHAYIDGKGFQDGGDLDGQGVLTIPIKLLVP